MSYRSRVKTLRLLAGSNRHMGGSSKLPAIYGELNRLESATRLATDRGWLLAVLHTTRMLDTTLSELLASKGWGSDAHSLGAYLKELDGQGILRQGERGHFQKTVVDKRNKYMHEAGTMPQKQEADLILAEMQTCLTVVFARM